MPESQYLTPRRSNQSILKEISPEYSLILKLKLQYFGHLMRRTDWLEKALRLGKIEWRQEKGTTEDEMAGWHHWLDGRESEWTPGADDGQGGPACHSPWGCKESDTTERLNWTAVRFTPAPSSSPVASQDKDANGSPPPCQWAPGRISVEQELGRIIWKVHLTSWVFFPLDLSL